MQVSKQRLSDIPFSEFQRCLVEGQTDMFQSPEDAKRLRLEFADATATARTLNNVKLENNIQLYVLKIELLRIITNALLESYSEELVSVLKKDFRLNHKFSKESYLADVKRVELESKRLSIRLDEYIKERDQRTGAEDSKPATYEGYAHTTMLMSKHVGYHLPRDISTLEWAVIFKDFVSSIDKAASKKWQKGK